MEGAAGQHRQHDVADQLFLRLAELGPTLTTAGDRAFVPLLARSWTRRDSLTLVFDLDPRARWHDGVPVTARDVVFTFARARDPTIAPELANAAPLHRRGHRRGRPPGGLPVHAAATPSSSTTPRFTCSRCRPTCSTRSPPTARQLARSCRPVGNGPYRWVRRVPGQFVELAANAHFFLGRPKIERVIFRLAARPGCPDQSAAERRSRRDRQHPAAARQRRPRRGADPTPGGSGPVAHASATCSSTSATRETARGPTRSWPTSRSAGPSRWRSTAG